MTKVKDTLANVLKKMGMEDEKVAALFNADGTELADNAEAELTAFDAARITKIKTTAKTEGFNQGHQKGLSEGASKWEKEASEEFEITSDKKGLDLIREIVEKKSSIKPEIEEDKVLAHPAFIKMKRELEKQVTAKETEWKSKYEARESELLKEKTFDSITQKAKAHLTSLKPVLPKDQAKQEKQMQMLVNELKGYEYKEVDGQIVILKDGKPFEDAHGKSIEFTTLVKNTAESIWDFQTGTQRSGTGNNNDDGAGAGGGKLKVEAPASKDEYVKRMQSAKTPEERIAITEAYKESQATEA